MPRPLPELQAERYGLNGGGAALQPNHRLVELQEPVEHPAADAVLVDYDIGEVVAPLSASMSAAPSPRGRR